ncbi:heparinase II/III family protein, partial [Ensifer sp. ZNC0028]
GGLESVTASHDGYLSAFGLVHERGIGVLNGGRMIRGRDRLSRTDGSDPEAGDTGVAVARFHIHPAVAIRQNSAREIFLTAPDGEIWLFACQDGELAVEEDIFFADPSGIRASQQLTVTFAIAQQPEIQWTFSRAN